MSESHTTYKPEEVKIRVIHEETSHKIFIIFSTLMETQFYSPGITIKKDINKDIFIQFIRSGIQDKNPRVDIKAEYLNKWLEGISVQNQIKEKIQEKSTPSDQIVMITDEVKRIYLMSGDIQQLIWTK